MNPAEPEHRSNSETAVDHAYEPPLAVEPDDPEEEHLYRTGPRAAPISRPTASQPISVADTGITAMTNGSSHASALPGGMGQSAGHLSDMLHWALDSLHEPALAAADWLARDIDPHQPTAAALLTNPAITLPQVQQAKSVFKTMRIVGEKSADRRVGARMYAASLAAGLVRHGQLISRQSEEALERAFSGLLDDQRMPAALRDLAGMALCAIKDNRYVRVANDHESERSPHVGAAARRPPSPAAATKQMPTLEKMRQRKESRLQVSKRKDNHHS